MRRGLCRRRRGETAYLRANCSRGAGWRARGQLVEADEAITFAPAIIKPSTGNPPSFPGYVEVVKDSPSSPSALAAPSRIEIVLMGGHRVIVDNSVDAAVLARVIAALERP